MIGGAYMGCADLLGARFDDLEPRPLPDASPEIEALAEVGEGAEPADVTTANGSRVASGDQTFPRVTDTVTAAPMSRATGEPPPPQLGGVEDPGVSSDAPQDDSEVGEDVGTDGGASTWAAPNDATPLGSAHEVPALPARSDAGVPDAGNDVSPPRRCAASSPFSRIEPVPGIPVNASRIRLSDDELTAHYSWLIESQWLDLFTSRRADRASPFGIPEALAPLNGTGGDTSPMLAPDGATLYFESSRTGFFRVHQAKRGDTGDWSPLGIVPNIAVVGFSDGGPYLSPRSGDLYFHSDRLGSSDLFRAARGQTGFDVPIALHGVSTQGNESFPLLSADERELYFIRVALGSGEGHSEIWMATRGSESEPFGDAHEVPELNTELIELPDWISPDNCRLYFSRMPATMWLGSVVYVAIREPASGATTGD